MQEYESKANSLGPISETYTLNVNSRQEQDDFKKMK